jgi:hypothetical protein
MMATTPVGPNRKRVGNVFLALGYLCAFALAANLAIRFGVIRARVPGLSGFAARLGWIAAAAVCFALAWYSERLSRPRRPDDR